MLFTSSLFPSKKHCQAILNFSLICIIIGYLVGTTASIGMALIHLNSIKELSDKRVGSLNFDIRLGDINLNWQRFEPLSFSSSFQFNLHGDRPVFIEANYKGISDPTIYDLQLFDLAECELVDKIKSTPIGNLIPPLLLKYRTNQRILQIDDSGMGKKVENFEYKGKIGVVITRRWQLLLAKNGIVSVETNVPIWVTPGIKLNPKAISSGGFHLVKNNPAVEGSIILYFAETSCKIIFNIAGRTISSNWVQLYKGLKAHPIILTDDNIAGVCGKVEVLFTWFEK